MAYGTPRVYFASKTSHAGLALDLREQYPSVHWTSRWPFLILAEVLEHDSWARQFWQDDFDDIWRSDVVMCYAEPEDKMRGALVEAGIALGLRKQVVVVGAHPDWSTWQYHPRVRREATIASAVQWCKQMAQTWERP